MARDLGIGVLPWSPLASGALIGKHRGRYDGKREAPMLDARGEKILSVLRDVATSLETTPARVALRWLTTRPGVAASILGVRTHGQLEDNLGCFDIDLSEEQRAALDKASVIELGFPHDFLASEQVRNVLTGGLRISRGA